MDYALRMHMIDSHEQLLHVACSFLLCESFTSFVCDFIEEFTAIDVFHHEVEEFIVIIGFEILDDVRVIKFVQYFCLLYHLIDVMT